jgi:HSP20 family molecular chaperone IbpA
MSKIATSPSPPSRAKKSTPTAGPGKNVSSEGESRYPLPEAVDANATQATHVDGVLQLTLPKIAKANAKQITIQ